MMMLRAVVILAVVMQLVMARKFSECGLARELRKLGVPNNYELNLWICIAKHESSLNTHSMHYNRNGSRDYGLFQINDRYWCERGRPGKGCHVKCEDLTNDNISDDLKCALHIRNTQGWGAWVAWSNKCAGRRLPDYTRC